LRRLRILESCGWRASRVGHENIDPSKLLESLLDEYFDIGLLADVGPQAQSLDAVLLMDLICGSFDGSLGA
jgi:hypothetical protein